jgi:hypothetical protein
MVVVAKLSVPLAAAQRLVVLVPPLTHREVGFPRAARTLKVMAAGKGLDLLVFAGTDDVADVRERLEATEPEARLDVRPVDGWHGLVPLLEEAKRPGDVFVVLSVRQGAVAWRPATSRLSRVLARRFAEHDLLSITLSGVQVERFIRESLEDRAAVGIAERYITLGVPAGEPHDVLARTLAPLFDDDPEAQAHLADQLLREAEAEASEGRSSEVMPGVALYYGRSPVAEVPVALMGLCPDGARLPATSSPTHVVLVYLAPLTLPPEEYLFRLSVMAQVVRDEETAEALRLAETPAEALEALMGSLRKVS